MKILTRSAIESHQVKLVQKQDGQRYSQYPVHEMEFWNVLFAHAKDPKTAQQVLDEIGDIENEPCIENGGVSPNRRFFRHLPFGLSGNTCLATGCRRPVNSPVQCLKKVRKSCRQLLLCGNINLIVFRLC